MVIPNFVRQGLSGQTITVHGDGAQTRSFCHVSDVVGALIQLVQEPNAVGEVFNIGNDQEISIMALAEKVRAMTGNRSAIVTIPYDQAYEAGFEDMPRRVPNLSKIQGLVGYAPKATLDDILGAVIEHVRNGQ
jgi:UDP-glucose 4-epimerase